jgi:hypothetical protein
MEMFDLINNYKQLRLQVSLIYRSNFVVNVKCFLIFHLRRLKHYFINAIVQMPMTVLRRIRHKKYVCVL